MTPAHFVRALRVIEALRPRSDMAFVAIDELVRLTGVDVSYRTLHQIVGEMGQKGITMSGRGARGGYILDSLALGMSVATLWDLIGQDGVFPRSMTAAWSFFKPFHVVGCSSEVPWSDRPKLSSDDIHPGVPIIDQNGRYARASGDMWLTNNARNNGADTCLPFGKSLILLSNVKIASMAEIDSHERSEQCLVKVSNDDRHQPN